MKDTIKNLFLSDWTPAEKGLLLADVLLFGVVIGWLTAPLRHGFRPILNGKTEENGKMAEDSGEYGKNRNKDREEEEEEDK